MPYVPPIISDQYTATDATQCINLVIPDGIEYKMLAFGLLNRACEVDNYDDPDSAQSEGLAAIWSDALTDTDWNNCMENTQSANNSMLLFADEFTIDTGNGNLIVMTTSQAHGFYVRQSTSANGDVREAYRYLVAGEWKSRILTGKTVSSGKMLPQIQDADGNITVLTERDLYGAASYNNYYEESFTLAVSGLTRLIIGTNGKNGSSSGYDVNVTLWSLWRTG